MVSLTECFKADSQMGSTWVFTSCLLQHVHPQGKLVLSNVMAKKRRALSA